MNWKDYLVSILLKIIVLLFEGENQLILLPLDELEIFNCINEETIL